MLEHILTKGEQTSAIYFGAVVVDMQSTFLGKLDQDRIPRLIKSQMAVLDFCIERDYPIAVLRYNRKGPTHRKIGAKVRTASHYKYFERLGNDGFNAPDLESTLIRWGVRNLIFMGISSGHCVQRTAKSAKEKKFHLFTAKPLLATQFYNEWNESTYNDWYRNNGVFATDYQDLLNVISACTDG